MRSIIRNRRRFYHVENKQSTASDPSTRVSYEIDRTKLGRRFLKVSFKNSRTRARTGPQART